MKKIFFIIKLLFLSFNFSVFATEKKCGTFDLGCKTKKIIDDTKKYQKKGLDKSKDQINKTKDMIKEAPKKILK